MIGKLGLDFEIEPLSLSRSEIVKVQLVEKTRGHFSKQTWTRKKFLLAERINKSVKNFGQCKTILLQIYGNILDLKLNCR